MKDCLRMIITCIAGFCISCGVSSEFEAAERYYLFQDYSSALDNLKAGLKNNPNEPYYLSLQEVCKRRLAEEYYFKACEKLTNGFILDAERNLEAVLHYVPEHNGANLKLAHIRKTRSHIQNSITQTREYVQKNDWDSAYMQILPLLIYTHDFPEIPFLFQQSKQGSFQKHFQLGQQAFANGNYAEASLEFQIAIGLIPTNSEVLEFDTKNTGFCRGQEWLEQADSFLQQTNTQIAQLQEITYIPAIQTNFEIAYLKYQETLSLLPNWQRALHGKSKLIENWIDYLTKCAYFLKIKAQTSRIIAFQTLRILEKAEKLSKEIGQNNQNIYSELLAIKKTCAEHLVELSKKYEKNLATVGMSHFCLKIAKDLDNSSVSPTLWQSSQKLYFEKFHRNVIIKSPLPQQNQTLVNFWQQKNLPSTSFFSYETYHSIQLKNPKQNIYILEFFFHPKKFIEKSGTSESIVSQYFSGLKPLEIKNIEEYLQEQQNLKQKLSLLFIEYRHALDQKELFRIDLLQSQNKKNMLQEKLKQFKEFQRQLEHWENIFRNNDLNTSNLAQSSLYQIKNYIKILSQETQESENIWQKNQQTEQNLNNIVQNLARNIQQIEASIEKNQRYIDKQKYVIPVGFYESYSWQTQKISNEIEFELSSKLSGLNLTATFNEQLSKKFEQVKNTDVHIFDISNVYNQPKKIPDEKLSLQITQYQGITKLNQQILTFWQEWPLKIVSFEENLSTTPVELEKFVHFLEWDQFAHISKCEAAQNILLKFLENGN